MVHRNPSNIFGLLGFGLMRFGLMGFSLMVAPHILLHHEQLGDNNTKTKRLLTKLPIILQVNITKGVEKIPPQLLREGSLREDGCILG